MTLNNNGHRDADNGMIELPAEAVTTLIGFRATSATGDVTLHFKDGRVTSVTERRVRSLEGRLIEK